jgi:hypothetical protein
MSGGRVIGWKLDPGERAALLDQFAPAYREVVADHVTLAVDEGGSRAAPSDAAGAVVGVADDGRGVQALVVAVDGSTDRPDGKVFHVTWSLDPGRRAVESNDVIAQHGWSAIRGPVPLTLLGRRF